MKEILSRGLIVRMKRGSRIVVTLVTVLLLVFTVACVPAVTEEEEVVTPPVTLAPTVEWGIIEIRVTDPPPADVEHVFVTLANIEVHRVSDNVTGWETIPIPTGNMTFDLMDVIGVEKVLGSANVTAGKYTQIRMDVAEVDVVFVTDNGTDNVTARVPSEKLRIVKPFEVVGGVKTILTLDFDGEKSLILPGKDIATGKEKAIFKPVVRLLVEHSSPSETGVEVEVEEEEIEEEEEVGDEGEEEDVGEEEEEEDVGEEEEEEEEDEVEEEEDEVEEEEDEVEEEEDEVEEEEEE